jgi:hypothetical protein
VGNLAQIGDPPLRLGDEFGHAFPNAVVQVVCRTRGGRAHRRVRLVLDDGDERLDALLGFDVSHRGDGLGRHDADEDVTVAFAIASRGGVASIVVVGQVGGDFPNGLVVEPLQDTRAMALPGCPHDRPFAEHISGGEVFAGLDECGDRVIRLPPQHLKSALADGDTHLAVVVDAGENLTQRPEVDGTGRVLRKNVDA